MEKLIDAVLTLVSVVVISAGGSYTVREVHDWSKKMALQKAAKGLGRLESTTQKMTGGKLDF